jgi:threonine dehydrogenase-like Zn-dependent dehydrogenase
MRALTVQPGHAGTARLEDVAEPELRDDLLLVRARALGVCGTDAEIVRGEYGVAPAGQRLILGHESLGEVVRAPKGSGFAEGDLVVGIVRRADPVPCASCAVGEWDMCRNGQYTEHGIKELHGFGAERFAIEPERVVRIDRALQLCGVLLEPASVLAKAWEQIDRIGARSAAWTPRTVLITGAGPIGLLAAMMAAQRGLEVHVFDRAIDGPKPELVRALSATYHNGALEQLALEPDIVIECTGAASVVFDAVNRTAAGGVVCLTGIAAKGRTIDIDFALLNRTMVLENDVVFGTVNANRRHYEAAASALARADRAWLERLITRRVPLERWSEALERGRHDVKVVLDFDL